MAQNLAVQNLKTQISAEKLKAVPIETLIQKSVTELGKALPKCMSAERLVRIALTSIRLNPKLASCTPESFLGALFQSAQLGLEPNIEGQAYLIPYNNSKKENGKWVKKDEVQFQIGYKGYIELFYRHGAACSIDMHTVYANDIFDYQYGTDPHLIHKPSLKDRGEPIAYYAIATLSNGGRIFKVMTHQECIEHGKTHSKCYITKKWDETKNRYIEVSPHFDENSPWYKEQKAMCKKTVLIQLAKLLPKSVELQKALAMDNTTKTKIDVDMFNIKDETNWEEKADLPPAQAGE